jgi:hypothetical protein
MPLAELETGNIRSQTIIEAPPPGTPPPPQQEMTPTQPLIASTRMEAIFSSPIILKNRKSKDDDDNPNIHDPLSDIPESLLLKSELQPAQRKIRDELRSGFSGLTHTGDEWYVMTGSEVQKLIPPMEKPYKLNGATEIFTSLQQEMETESQHGKMLQFLAGNWREIASLLTESDIAPDQELRCWVEVDLTDYHLQTNVNGGVKEISCGQIDLLGELPDGQLVIIDVKARKHRSNTRSQQLAKHSVGIQEVIRRHNNDVRLPRISQYIGIYDNDKPDEYVIDLQSKSENYLPFLSASKNETVLYQLTSAAAD